MIILYALEMIELRAVGGIIVYSTSRSDQHSVFGQIKKFWELYPCADRAAERLPNDQV
jgi:hypothetical protein